MYSQTVMQNTGPLLSKLGSCGSGLVRGGSSRGDEGHDEGDRWQRSEKFGTSRHDSAV